MTRPVVLYACIHNSGRSVAAQVLTEHHGGGRVEVRSAGSEPGSAVNEAVALVLAERGMSAEGHVPSLLTYDGVQEADVVITMGCGETCPVAPGKRYEDWAVADPKGRPIEQVRLIVDDVERRVLALLASLPPTPTPTPTPYV